MGTSATSTSPTATGTGCGQVVSRLSAWQSVGSAGTGTLAVQRRSLLEEGLEAGWRCLSWPLRCCTGKNLHRLIREPVGKGNLDISRTFRREKEALVCRDILEQAETLRQELITMSGQATFQIRRNVV